MSTTAVRISDAATATGGGGMIEARRALGLALAGRAEATARACDETSRATRWVGAPASDEYLERGRVGAWFAILLMARWLVTGVGGDGDEMAWIGQRGRMAAAEQLSVINLARDQLVWRDATCAVLEEEAPRLGTPPAVLDSAVTMVRLSCDRGVMTMVSAFDDHLRTLSEELEGEQAALTHYALHDQLTGLPNRTLLHDRLGQAVLGAQRSGQGFAVLVIDLDGFKAINDSLGHRSGDLVLQGVARQFIGAVRDSDTVARPGGDEFIALLPGADEQGATLTARRILKSLRRPLHVEGQAVTAAASIGIAAYPAHGRTVQGLLAAADDAMYRAKKVLTGTPVERFAVALASHGGAASEVPATGAVTAGSPV